MTGRDLSLTVRHFAALREARGTDREIVQVPVGTTLRDLYGRLFAPHPEGPLPVACMRNRHRVDPDTAVAEGDEVAFLPPFGGG
jgi:sulfur-carrier protein